MSSVGDAIQCLTWEPTDRCSEPERSWSADVRVDGARPVTVECWFTDSNQRRWRLLWPGVIDHALYTTLTDDEESRSLTHGLRILCNAIDTMARNARQAADSYDMALGILRTPPPVPTISK